MLMQYWARRERNELHIHCPLEFDLLIVHLLQFIFMENYCATYVRLSAKINYFFSG